jgi:C1A family cysteine protease
MHTKAAVAGLGAAAALTGAALMYKAPSNVKLFADDRLSDEDYKFMAYVSEYGKSYGTVAEFMFRKEHFTTRHRQIEAWNSGNETHTLGHNHFSDRTYAEMKKLNGYQVSEQKNVKELDDSNLEASVDWRSKNAVTPVKNQGQCGSCWAFSTTGAVEAAYFLKHGTLKSFSEQQLVDCAGGIYHNNGCNGGLMDYAFQYIEKNPLELEADYPYHARDGTCKATKTKEVGTVAGYNDVPHTADQLRAALNKSTVSVAIEADQMAFQAYRSGVITKGCGTRLDHGVLAVGYGTLNGQDYFLVKNSWGSSWGDQGYVRIGANNVCGILLSASYPHE